MSKQVAVYIVVSFGFSWAIAAIIALNGGLSQMTAAILLFPYMLGPCVGALICAWKFNKGERLKVLGLKGGWNLWLLWAWLIGIGLIVGATAISLLGPGVELRPPVEGIKDVLAAGPELDPAALASVEQQLAIPYIDVVIVLQAILLGAALNTPLLLSEELGWRGWLWHALRPKGFWKATFWIGLLWGLWHIPIIVMGHNYPGMPVLGPIIFIGFCLLYSPLFSYVREKSKSVWAPCVLHGTTNAVAGVAIMMQTHSDMPWTGLVGVGGFIVLFLATIWVYFKVKGNTVVTA